MKAKPIVSTLVFLTFAVFSAHAQTWSSTTGGNWTNGANWSSTPVPPVNDGTAAIIFNSAPGTLTSAIDTGYSINSLTFGTSTGAWTISGSALTLGAGGITNNGSPASSGVQTISAAVTIGASQTWNPGTQNGVNRTVNLSGAITGAADKTISVSGSQASSLNRLYQVSLNNSATLSSLWTVGSGGRLLFAANEALGTGAITVNSGGYVGGSSGSFSISNAVTLAGGGLRSLGAGDGGSYNGSLAITANSTVEFGSGNIGINNSSTNTITGSGNLTVTGTSATKSLTIGNAGGVSNANTGTLIISTGGRVTLNKANDTNAWGGNIQIDSGGTLLYRTDVARRNQLNDSATVTINGTGTWNTNSSATNQTYEKVAALVVNGATPFTEGATLSRILVGTGTLATGAAGVFVNSGGTLSGNGTVNKATTIDGGNVSVGNGGVGALGFSQSLSLVSLAAASLQFELGADTAAGVTYDTVNLSGAINLNIGSGLLDFDRFQFTNIAGFAPGVYTLFNSDNTITGTLGSNLSGFIDGRSSSLSFADSNQDIILTVIPEPGAVLLGSIGVLTLLRRRRA